MDSYKLDMDLNGKVALVTGSTAGLGHKIACTLGQAGAQVALNYKNNETRALAAFDRYLETRAKGALFRADITDEKAVSGLVESVSEKLGSIDILVINATPPQPQRPLEAYQWSDVQSMLDAFVKSPFLLCQSVVPTMKAQGFGRIIQIGSEVFEHGTSNFSAYVAAKGGQHGLTRSLSQELAPFGITVNTVSPGWVPVERHINVPKADKLSYLASVPMERFGTPNDVAGAVAYLASPCAAFVTGANLHVNGGRTIQ